MPSQSKKQHNLMAMVANNPAAAKRLNVPQSVGEEFMKADKGKKFKEGGASMKSDLMQDKKVVKKAMSMHDKQAHGGKMTNLAKLKKGGMPFEMSKKDVEKKGMKEGSKQEEAFDRMQMMKKPAMKFAKGGHIKRYSGATDDGSMVEGQDIYKDARDRDDSADLFNERLKSSVRRAVTKPAEEQAPMERMNTDIQAALAGKRPAAPDYKLLPSKPTGLAGAVAKVEKSQGMGAGRGSMAGYDAKGDVANSARREFAKNTANQALEEVHPEQYFTPGFGVKTIASGAKALANMGGRNALKLAGEAGEGVLSAAGRRLKDVEQLREKMFPGRDAAVLNPNAWTAGPKGMGKIAEAEGRATAAEARAAAAAAKKKAAQAKKDAKDPVMNAKPGADKAKPASKYETDEAMDASFGYKRGGSVQRFAKGGSVSSASSRGDGIAIRGKTKGTLSKMCGGGMYKGKK